MRRCARHDRCATGFTDQVHRRTHDMVLIEVTGWVVRGTTSGQVHACCICTVHPRSWHHTYQALRRSMHCISTFSFQFHDTHLQVRQWASGCSRA
jgi:hypothetical protein